MCIDITPSPLCSENQFLCDSGQCVPRLHVCDGQFDCNAEEEPTSDELGCGKENSTTIETQRQNKHCVCMHECVSNKHWHFSWKK